MSFPGVIQTTGIAASYSVSVVAPPTHWRSLVSNMFKLDSTFTMDKCAAICKIYYFNYRNCNWWSMSTNYCYIGNTDKVRTTYSSNLMKDKIMNIHPGITRTKKSLALPYNVDRLDFRCVNCAHRSLVRRSGSEGLHVLGQAHFQR